MTTRRLSTIKAALAAAAVAGIVTACGGAAATTASTASPAAVETSETSTPAAAEPTGSEATRTGGGTESSSESSGVDSGSESSAVEESGIYQDGTYTADGGYVSPGGQETVTVEITLDDDVVTAVTVTPHPSNPNTEFYQGQFAGGIAGEIVGLNIDELSVSHVSGSSLTSGGFNAALEAIKSQARG